MRIEMIETVMLGTHQLSQGVQVDIDAEKAQALVKSGKARLLNANAESSASDTNARVDEIVAAVRDLVDSDPEKADESFWTKSGKPDVKAIEALLGYDITAAERDAAWDEVNG